MNAPITDLTSDEEKEKKKTTKAKPNKTPKQKAGSTAGSQSHPVNGQGYPLAEETGH